jgi:hypothetical protein
MRLLESSAINQLRLGGGSDSIALGDRAGSEQRPGNSGFFGKQRLLMQYIVVSNLHQSLTDFIQRHNDSHRSFYICSFVLLLTKHTRCICMQHNIESLESRHRKETEICMFILFTISISVRLARVVYKAMWQVAPLCEACAAACNSHLSMQRMDDLKIQLRSSSSNMNDRSSGVPLEADEEDGLQFGLSAAAAALQSAHSHAVKQQQQEHLQCSLPHLHLQLQLHAADNALPSLSLQREIDIMAAAQQGR